MDIGIASGRGRRDVTRHDLCAIGAASQGSAQFLGKIHSLSSKNHLYRSKTELSLQIFTTHALQLVSESPKDEKWDGQREEGGERPMIVIPTCKSAYLEYVQHQGRTSPASRGTDNACGHGRYPLALRGSIHTSEGWARSSLMIGSLSAHDIETSRGHHRCCVATLLVPGTCGPGHNPNEHRPASWDEVLQGEFASYHA